MRVPRIYEAQLPLKLGSTCTLSAYGAGHVSRVLRLKSGASIKVFDGLGHEFLATLEEVGKQTVIKLEQKLQRQVESPLQVELLQVISRGDRMDFTIQKAVELGVNRIIPLTSERCGVKLDNERAAKKVESYQKIAIAACEQCGRNVVPKVEAITSLTSCLANIKAEFDAKRSLSKESSEYQERFLNLTLDPLAEDKITSLPATGHFRLLIGPEGGLTEAEIQLADRSGFLGISLGPRILRTETAALVCLSILGSHFGDL